jgi:hypothetical protein
MRNCRFSQRLTEGLSKAIKPATAIKEAFKTGISKSAERATAALALSAVLDRIEGSPASEQEGAPPLLSETPFILA